jgi:hypothetical protein
MFTVLGGLIDRLELSVQSRSKTVPMGSTLLLDRAGEDVTVTLRVRMPAQPNLGRRMPALHHIDIIAGDILGPATDRDAMTNPTTKIVAQVRAAEAKREGDYYVVSQRFPKVKQSFYVRVRGTNTDLDAPRQDTATVNPWNDLWFYSNPVMVRVPGR